ncbi:FG-GAP repeat protein [Marinicella rhabdoformis]|uniref:FG-GAP repeat protein n=1 Tax=Marinicella rhabdoformis TaxID=2580566 RepID=UPI0012AEDCCA|nr:FG-GAP repeat protein [Marinicella rhabdoformis]
MKHITQLKYLSFLILSLIGGQSSATKINHSDNTSDNTSINNSEFQFKSALQQQKLTAFDGMADDFYGTAVSISNNRALVGSKYHDPSINQVTVENAGAVYYYEYENGQWTFKQKIIASDADTNDQFGNAISLSGDRLMIGSFRNDEESGDAGAVYVFEFNNSTWVETEKLTASDAANSDWFGYTIAVHQDTAMIAASSNDDLGNRSGKIYVFNHDGQNWIEGQKLTTSDGTDNTRLGASISLSTNRMVAGANFHPTNGLAGGAAYVFEYNSNNSLWEETQQLLSDSIIDGANFGHAVSLSGDRILVGAIEDTGIVADSGAAYLFEYDGQSWALRQKITEAAVDGGDEFGSAVSVVGDRLYIGAQNAGFNGAYSGVVYVYDRLSDDMLGTDWVKSDEIFGLDTNARDEFGVSISMDGGQMMIGAHRDFAVANNGGSAYIMDASFPVKVSVTGLSAGNDFIIQNNGGDDLTITENSTVMFPTQLYQGDNYTVSVASHPSSPNQTCAVKQTESQINANGQNNVEVACVYTPYFVAGHVLNLIDGNQMTLQNNQADDLIINQRGAFIFALPLNDLEDYEVIISSMPNDPIQPCTVIDGQGTIEGADINDVVISCQQGDDLIYKSSFESLDN